MRIGKRVRRALHVLVGLMLWSIGLTLFLIQTGNPLWAIAVAGSGGMVCFAVLIWICDRLTCAADAAQPDIDWSACKRVRRARAFDLAFKPGSDGQWIPRGNAGARRGRAGR